MYNLALSQEQIGIISAALSEMPYRLAAPVIATLAEQVRGQTPNGMDEVVGTPLTTPPSGGLSHG